jgi:tetratricopeptide (TPR) repeat protein
MRVLARILAPLLLVPLLAACQADEARLEEHLERGDGYLEQEQYGEAIIEYKNVLQLDPNHAAAHWGLARAYLRNRQTREGFWELRETARLDPDNLEAKLQFGQLSMYAGELEESLKQANEVIAGDPNRVTGHLLKGRALEALRRPDEAQAAYAKAVEVDPDSSAALLLLAIHHRRRGDRETAEPLYHKLTEVSPTPLSYSALGGFLARDRERDTEAEAAYEKAIELATPEERVRTISILAGFYFSRDRFDQAVETLEKGIETEEDPLDLIYLLARIQRAQGNVAKADQLIEQATLARPDDPRPQLILSSYLGRKGDMEGALAAAEKAVSLDPENQLARLRKAEVLVEIGYRDKDDERIAEGRSVIEAILATEPSQPGALFVKAKIDLSEGNLDEAITSLRTAIDARPEWAQAHFLLGTAQALRGESSIARAELARALEIDAGLIEARKVLSRVHARLREYEYAVEEGRRYLREVPGDVETRLLVAQALVMLGKQQEALKELEAINERQRDANALFAMGRVHVMLGDEQQGRTYFLRAYEKAPQQTQILASLITLDVAEGRVAESAARIEEALEESPDNAKLHQLRGLVYLRQDRGSDAEQSFRRAIALDPSDVETYDHGSRTRFRRTRRRWRRFPTPRVCITSWACCTSPGATGRRRSPSTRKRFVSTRTWRSRRTTSPISTPKAARISTRPWTSPRRRRPSCPTIPTRRTRWAGCSTSAGFRRPPSAT